MRTARPRARSHSINFGARASAALALGLEIIPTVLMMGIQQELPVAFGAGQRALDDGGFKSERAHGLFHSPASGAMQLRVAYNPALPHLALAHFKLRFDQYNHLACGPQ